MTTETMTVHKALAELKLLDARILKAIKESTFCVPKKHSSDEVNGISVDEFEKQMQGGYDKATELIKRRKAIKKAVVLSNAVTKVRIANEEYTVCEAIEMKNHGITFDTALLNEMQMSYNDFQALIERQNGESLEQKAEEYIKAVYGQSESKTNPKQVEEARALFIKNHSYEMVDPLCIVDKMSELDKKINDFMSEVDAALSVSNAITEITIEY